MQRGLEAENRDEMVSHLYSQCLQIGEQTSWGQPQKLIPREVELSQERQGHSEVSQIVVAQIQHLYMIKDKVNCFISVCLYQVCQDHSRMVTLITSRVMGRQGVMLKSLALEMLRNRKVEGQEQP